MAMPLGMVARYDMISPDVHVSTCTTIYHSFTVSCLEVSFGDSSLEVNVPRLGFPLACFITTKFMVKVQLFKDGYPVPDALYHPRLGFILSNITSDSQNGTYVCLFTSVFRSVLKVN